MKQKINWLIGISGIVLIALCAMQIYLVKTTFDYKSEEFKAELKAKIEKVTQNFSTIDTLIFNKKDILYKQLASNCIENSNFRFQIKNALFQNEFKKELTQRMQREFDDEIPDLKIDFALILNKFILIHDAKKADTIFAEKPVINNQIYGNLTNLNNTFLVRNYVGTTSGLNQNENYKLLTEDTLYVTVLNWENIILQRMTLVLIFAIGSILILISLFVIALKALIQQKKLNEIKTDFINNITHELKTPLATLTVATKILERKEIRDDDANFNTILSSISRQNHRLQNLVDQVISCSFNDSELELQKEKIEIESFLDVIVSDFSIANPNVIVKTDFRSFSTNLILDKFHLTTAFLNVLENAVKYGCTTINIETTFHNNWLNINIQDNGIGIAKNKHSLLFDKFYRVEQGNLHTTKGLGLGLYYVNKIINAHQGFVAVKSDLGKGAAFQISIPSL